MKNFAYLFGLSLYAIGTINGIGYSCYIGEWVTAVGVAILAVMAWPTVKKWFNSLMLGE